MNNIAPTASRQGVIPLLHLLTAFAFWLGAPALAQTIRWEMPTEYPASSMPGEGLRHLAEQVTARGNGQFAIVPSFDASAGLKSAAMPEAVRSGRLPMADAFAGSLGGIDPVFLVTSLPFLATTVEEARRLYDAAKPSYDRVLAGLNQRILYATPWPPSGLWAKTPVTRPEDLRGLPVRTYDATGTAVLRNAGAAAVELSFADAMPKLKDGSLAAVLSSGDGGAGRRLWEFLPHFTAINYAMPISLATVNLDALNALSPELRAVLLAAAADTEARQWSLIRGRLEANHATMRSNGVSIVTEPTPELRAALRQAADSAIADWVSRAGDDGAAVLRRYRGG